MNVKLLKDLDFATKISEAKAATSAGQDCLNTYKSYLFNNSATCSLVNGFVAEASKYSYDTGLVSILESVQNFINENNISWQLASACESVANNNSPYAYIAKVGVSQVQKLLEQNEADVVQYIKAGALKQVQYIPEFRNVCKQVYKTQINEAYHVNYNVTVPVGYVMSDASNNKYFRIAGHDFKITESCVEEVSTVNDKVYTEMNALLESFTKNGDEIFYEYLTPRKETIRYTITDEGLTLTKGKNINEKFADHIKFMEYCDTLSKVMPIAEKMDFMNKSNAVATVFENYDNVVELDCAKIINTNNGFSGAIIEGKDNVNLTVFHSVSAGNSSNSYQYMAEALKQVTKLTGLDLSAMYENRINEDCKKIPSEEQKQIAEQLQATKDAQFAIRKKKIAMLAESYKNDPVKIALLNKIAKDLNSLENK